MTIEINRRSFIWSAATAAAMPALAVPAIAQSWPSKPIRIVCGYAAGGLTDLFARHYGEFISQQLGQPVIVDNKTGANGSVAAVEVKRSAPDGYTLLFGVTSTLVSNRLLIKDLPYDPGKDFSLISAMVSGGLVMVASPETKATNLQEFLDYARMNPVGFGSFGLGGTSHLVIEGLNKQYGLSMQAIQYRGEAPMWADMAGGTLQAAIGSWGPGQSVLTSGRVKPIAVTQRKRLRKLPDVATFIEQGATSKAFGLRPYVCAVAPAGTPDAIVSRYSDLFVAGGKSEKVQRLLDNFGIDEAAMNREQFRALYDEETPITLELIAELGLKSQ